MNAVTSTAASHQAQAAIMPVFGIAISDLTQADALGKLLFELENRHHTKLAFCNAHTANTAWSKAEFRAVLDKFTILADGIGIDIAAKWLHGHAFRANLNGTDFVPTLLQASTVSRRIAMIGGKPGIAEKAAKELSSRSPEHRFGPVIHGFSDQDATADFLETLKTKPVDVLLVAMGNPKQEEWIAANITGEHATLVIGVGALFDFLAGEVIRAPQWVRAMRLEWLFRLMQEPGRLFQRYVIGNPLFLARVLMTKIGWKSS